MKKMKARVEPNDNGRYYPLEVMKKAVEDFNARNGFVFIGVPVNNPSLPLNKIAGTAKLIAKEDAVEVEVGFLSDEMRQSDVHHNSVCLKALMKNGSARFLMDGVHTEAGPRIRAIVVDKD